MCSRKVVVYYAWSRPGEVGAPLEVVEDRFPTLFESRRMQYPRFEEFSDPARFNQGIGGFLDHSRCLMSGAAATHPRYQPPSMLDRKGASLGSTWRNGWPPLYSCVRGESPWRALRGKREQNRAIHEKRKNCHRKSTQRHGVLPLIVIAIHKAKKKKKPLSFDNSSIRFPR